MSKRNLFEELKTGLVDAKEHDQGKLTLKTTSVTAKEQTLLTADEISAIRERLGAV